MSGVMTHELVIPNDTKYLATVREAVGDLIRKSQFPGDDLSRIILAVDEAVANIIEHAYASHNGGEAEIELVLHADLERFEVLVRDGGQRFDPDRIQTPDMETHVREGRKSGLGIFLMRKIMDQVNYRFRDDGSNELQMIKFANPGSRG